MPSVPELLNHFTVDEIESSLVSFFVEKYNIGTKNKLIRQATYKTTFECKNEVRIYLNEISAKSDFENLQRLFELLIEPTERKLNGAFYTPSNVVDYVISKTINRNTLTVCDFSCGAGAFLVKAASTISNLQKIPISRVIENYIFGVDLFERSIFRTKIMLTLLMLLEGETKVDLNFNLFVADSLNLPWKDLMKDSIFERGFDVVVGNPPYVNAKNLPDSVKIALHNSARWQTAASGKADLFIPFIELGIELINQKGTLGLLVPNTYLTQMASKQLREFLRRGKYVREIIDFDHLLLFQDATIYTCVSIFDKKEKNSFRYTLIDQIEILKSLSFLGSDKFVNIHYNQLDSRKWILLGQDDNLNIRKIEAKGEPLRTVCKIRTGLATLRNDLYVIASATLNEFGYYEKMYHGKSYQIEPEITKEVLKSGAVKDEKYIEQNKMRIIYPYHKPRGSARIRVIREDVIAEKYPKCYLYFQAIRTELSMRDRGKKKYDAWYSYGRTQGLDNGNGSKLISADMGLKPRFVLCKKEGVMFFTGYGYWLNKNERIDLETLAKILNSRVFYYYINRTSKRYANDYRSYAKRFIENFSIPDFTQEELSSIRKNECVDEILLRKYDLVMTEALSSIMDS